MLSNEEFRKILILGHLTDDMLDKLRPLVDDTMFSERDVVFREGEAADRFYMVKRGKVLLEKRLSEKVTASVGAVKAGFSFGWSALLDDGAYTSDAVCAEVCEILSIQRESLLNLMNADHSLGYIFMQRLLRIVKNRLDHRTEQFMRAIGSHPDIRSLFEPQPRQSPADETR